MPTIDGLGGLFNIIVGASGIHVKMREGEYVTFVSHVAAGNQVLTLKESIDGSGEQALSVIESVWKSPGTGGTWTEVTQTASDTFTHADGTNNAVVFTVQADQLSDTFTCVECTASTGTLHAVLHGLRNPAAPANLASPVP